MIQHICMIDRPDDFCEGKRPVTRPPLAWFYIEKLKGE